MSIAFAPTLQQTATVAKRALQPLDIIFLVITMIIPIETIMQAFFGASMAFGRFIAPLFILFYLALRPQAAAFRLPPGVLLIVPYFVIAFGHIAAQGTWFGVYNYRSYVLNAILGIAAYNYALFNRPSVRSVLLATYVGIVLIAVWAAVTGQMTEASRGGRFSMFELDENGLGSTYGLAVVIAVVLASRPDVGLIVKTLLVAGAMPCAALLLATGSRGALVSTLLGIVAQALYLAIVRRRGGVLVGLLVLGAVVGVGKTMYDQTDVIKRRMTDIFVESKDPDRLGHRDTLALIALQLIAESPIIGWGEIGGWDQIGDRMSLGSGAHKGTHNTYLLVVVTAGVFAGGAFLWWALRPMIPRRRLLASQDYANLYIVMVFIYGTFLTLDRLGHRQWWWLFPLFLAQAGFAGAAARQAPATRLPHGSPVPLSPIG